MPRKGVKYKQQYTEEYVEKAVEKVRTSHLSYCQAKTIYSVPTSMISDKINRVCVKPNSSKSGPECYLSLEIEQRTYKWLLKMARIGYWQTKPDLFHRIQMIVHHLKIPTLFVDDWPREKWYRLFLHRFPNLALWQVQLLSKLRARVSCKAINQWFDELQEYLFKTANMDILEQPNRIYNCDEMGFLMVPCPTKVIASNGDSHIYQQGASTKAQITVLPVPLLIMCCHLWFFQARIFARSLSRSSTTFFLMLFSDTPQLDGWTRTCFLTGWNKVSYLK